jgi:hypothetical protein
VIFRPLFPTKQKPKMSQKCITLKGQISGFQKSDFGLAQQIHACGSTLPYYKRGDQPDIEANIFLMYETTYISLILDLRGLKATSYRRVLQQRPLSSLVSACIGHREATGENRSLA